jgi:hypothetical protein
MEEMINEANEVGRQIEAELQTMFEQGKTTWEIEEIRKVAKKTYDLIFDSYEEDEENGVETSNFALVEDKENEMVFKLTKK